MADREFLLKIVGDVSSAQKSIGQLESDVSGFKSTAGNVAKGIAAGFAVGAVVEFGKATVSAASEQEQALGAAQSVFKDYAGEIERFGDTTASNLGVAKGEFLNLAAVTGSLLKNAGVPLDETAASTTALTERAADMAAMFGGSVSDALSAINSGLKGELDPLEKFGVSLKASTVDAKAQAMGFVDAEGKVTDYGRAQARIALIMEQSADSAGTFARESDTLAGQQAILGAQFKDLQADLGARLLPVVVKFAGVFRSLVDFVMANQSWLIPTVAAIGGLVAAMWLWTAATTAWTTITEIASAVQVAFNAVIAMNPIMLVVIAIAALIAALVLAYKKVDWFREGVDTALGAVVAAWNWVLDIIKSVFNWVKNNWPLLLAIITGPIGLAVLAIVKHWDTIRSTASNLVSAIGNIIGGIVGAISGPFQTGARLVGDALGAIVDGIQWVGRSVGNALSGVGNAISAPFKAAFGAIKSFWNSTVGGFGFSIPSWVPGVGGKSFRIPEMALGGIVTKPTVALIGEAGPEAVIPLGKGGFAAGVTINVYALTANAEVGRQVWNALREYERSTGRAVA